jgi:dTDP-4-dehydrorhamnose 3,5-epimerase
MKIIKTHIPDVLIIEPTIFEDSRGFFMETFHVKRYNEYGIKEIFVQDNHSQSFKNVLRGLHYQLHNPQAKLIQVISGEVFDVAVDIRLSSPTFGQWVSVYLSETNKRQFFIPVGFAHGFLVLSDMANLIYKCSDFYVSGDEYGIRWDDPTLDIKWPSNDFIISKKDNEHQFLRDLSPEYLFI